MQLIFYLDNLHVQFPLQCSSIQRNMTSWHSHFPIDPPISRKIGCVHCGSVFNRVWFSDTHEHVSESAPRRVGWWYPTQPPRSCLCVHRFVHMLHNQCVDGLQLPVRCFLQYADTRPLTFQGPLKGRYARWNINNPCLIWVKGHVALKVWIMYRFMERGSWLSSQLQLHCSTPTWHPPLSALWIKVVCSSWSALL